MRGGSRRELSWLGQDLKTRCPSEPQAVIFVLLHLDLLAAWGWLGAVDEAESSSPLSYRLALIKAGSPEQPRAVSSK